MPADVIAVFGGSRKPNSEVKKAACRLGAAVTRHHMLLTGGTGPADDSVKNCAIAGARTKAWVGVAQKKEVKAFRHSDALPCGLCIWSDLRDKRNYLEAMMCDGAFVLRGEEGTLSELTCALSLQRPVVLLGWGGELKLDDPTQLDKLVATTHAKFFGPKESANHELDELLSCEVLRSGLNSLPAYKYVDSTTDDALRGAVAWLTKQEKVRRREFPDIPSHRNVATAYRVWLEACS
jgi:hypothetical protein